MISRKNSTENDPPGGYRDEIISYQKLRTFIGITGLLLSVMVVIGCFLFGAGKYSLQASISHYYYSVMHLPFVGVLCVLGGFLLNYKGKDKYESRLSNFAGCCAFGIALFPTRFRGFLDDDAGSYQYLRLCKDVPEFWNGVHFAFATALFICFSIFCLRFFQKPDETYSGIELIKFERRKRLYKICGWVILGSIAMIALFQIPWLPNGGIFKYVIFIFETTGLWAFGTAWLVKGSAILKQVPVVKKVIQPLR